MQARSAAALAGEYSREIPNMTRQDRLELLKKIGKKAQEQRSMEIRRQERKGEKK